MLLLFAPHAFPQSGKASVEVPFLLLLAGRDRIIDNIASRRFFDALSAPHKELLEYVSPDFSRAVFTTPIGGAREDERRARSGREAVKRSGARA